MEQCVKQFDVALSLKANKSQMNEYEQRIHTEFIDVEKWIEVKEKQENMNSRVDATLQTLNGSLETTKSMLTKSIQSVCEELMKARFAKYEQVWNDFKKFFTSDELSL